MTPMCRLGPSVSDKFIINYLLTKASKQFAWSLSLCTCSVFPENVNACNVSVKNHTDVNNSTSDKVIVSNFGTNDRSSNRKNKSFYQVSNLPLSFTNYSKNSQFWYSHQHQPNHSWTSALNRAVTLGLGVPPLNVKGLEKIHRPTLKLSQTDLHIMATHLSTSPGASSNCNDNSGKTACENTHSHVRISQQNFDYFLVLDFEATCSNEARIKPQEIIEFPVLKINGKTFQTEAIFHQYVEPQVHKELTPFCTELTGIIQDMVDGQPHLENTLQRFNKWMHDQGLSDPAVKSVFVTCGDWDLKTMLPGQCQYFGLTPENYFQKWINIKRAFSDVVGQWPKGMMPMLQILGIQHQGRHHSGIDDCRNIASILKKLAEKGYVYRVTGYLR